MRKQFDFYGYNSPTNGYFYVDDAKYFSGEDYRNVKRYREYKDAGFTLLLLQHENSYSGEPFEGSACKLCMDNAYKAGIKKIIVSDVRLKDLCVEKCVVGKDGRFGTEKEFLEYLDFCTAPYRNYKGFYGVQLFDEPTCEQMRSYGTVCRGLHKLFPDMYLQCNMLTIDGSNRLSKTEKNPIKAFREYLNLFLDESGMDSVLYDEYPFRRNYIIGGYSLSTYQVAAGVARDRNVEFRNVLQSWEYMWQSDSGKPIINPRRCVKQDMYWQLNLLMGMGCREYAFFTYFTKQHVDLNPKLNMCMDGASLINRDGTRTRLYYDVKNIISEMKKFAPVVLKYRYHENYIVFGKGKTAKDFMQTEFTRINGDCPISVKPSDNVALITEQKNGRNSLFMLENICNLKDELATGQPIEYEIDLGKDYKKVNVYYKGKKVKRKIKDGRFTEKLRCGDAIFMEILR